MITNASLGTSGWVIFSECAGIYQEILCCDSNHSDFGMVSAWTINCGNGKPVANSFLDVIRGMYFK